LEPQIAEMFTEAILRRWYVEDDTASSNTGVQYGFMKVFSLSFATSSGTDSSTLSTETGVVDSLAIGSSDEDMMHIFF
ncbi:hypothetical protein Tco_1348202, partial [Tanacetum coccineum]